MKESKMRFLERLAYGLSLLGLAAILTAAVAMGGTQSGAAVKLGSTSLGRVLVDSHGKTLYIWAHDHGSKSTCNGDCAEYWPPLITRGMPQAMGGVNQSLLGMSRRSDGRMQVTYAGHPLYGFVQDAKRGQVKGEGLTGFGGRWDPISAAGRAVRKASNDMTGDAYNTAPLKLSVLSPQAGDSAGSGGTFTVDLSLQARNAQANALLSGYKSAFVDPNSAAFHPGASAVAPGLVVLLSTTPSIAGTPLVGAKTNLAGVFQINDVARLSGLRHTFHSWIVTSPGFFGKNVRATLTAYAVSGAAPAAVTGNEKPISNVVRESFTIAG
jgi:predicted lipoprotein with Yx(FWY)xxD motif